jgi:hypothetical protein
VEIELIPSPADDDPAARAAADALVREGLTDEVLPAGTGVWRRAGLLDALESRVTQAGAPWRGPATQVDYVSPAPSSRGATRA